MVDPLASSPSTRRWVRVLRQRPVERTTAMDIAMLALALGFFAAALAYVSACNAL
jgi:hypothetical protein